MRGFKYRMGIRIWNMGRKLRLHWVMSIGDSIKRSAMGDFV